MEELGGKKEQGKKAAEWANEAKIDEKEGQYGRAIERITKAIELEPNNVSYLEQRADCFRRVNLYDNALQDYSKVIELAPG